MLSAIILSLICTAILLLCHLLNSLSLSTKEKGYEVLISLWVVQAGKWEAKKMCPLMKKRRQAECPQREQGTEEATVSTSCSRTGEHLQGNEPQLNLVIIIKVMMHSLLSFPTVLHDT